MRFLTWLLISFGLHFAFSVWLDNARSLNRELPTVAVSSEPRKLNIELRTVLKPPPKDEPLVAEKEPAEPKPEVKPPPPKPKPKKKPQVKTLTPPDKVVRKQETPKPKPPKRPLNYQSAPREVTAAEYASNPPPEYPRRARMRNQQGKVVLLVSVSSAGRVNDIEVVNSSGFSALDRSALDTVQKWRFVPAMRNGTGINSKVKVPIEFVLKD